MTKKPRHQPNISSRGRNDAAERQERRAEALRENLRKRKEQAQNRREEPPAKDDKG